MKRFTLAKRVREGDEFPRGYRVAWHEPWDRVGVFYPIGIHWPAIALRRLWEWSFWCPRSPVELAYWRGHKDGYDAGYKAGQVEQELPPVTANTSDALKPKTFEIDWFPGDSQK